MSLDRVTITGADNSVSQGELIELSAHYPFVEWGILYSRAHEGDPRYPSREWRERLQQDCRGTPVKLSLHLCGSRLRALLIGANMLPIGLTEGFQRMQLNFHGETLTVDLKPFCACLEALPIDQFIFQIDGGIGGEIIDAVYGAGISKELHPLFDTSHGAGVLPDRWPAPDDVDYQGYAGGLGPDNLADQIPLILEAAGAYRIWIDMESKVRSHGDLLFDLHKVESCLRIAQEFVH